MIVTQLQAAAAADIAERTREDVILEPCNVSRCIACSIGRRVWLLHQDGRTLELANAAGLAVRTGE